MDSLVTFNTFSSYSPASHPTLTTNYFLSLWIYLFQIPHMNGIVQHVTFGVCFLSLGIFSKLIHVVAQIDTSLLFYG